MGKFEKKRTTQASRAAQSGSYRPRRRKKKNVLPLILILLALVLVLAVVLVGCLLRDDGRIIQNLYVAGVDLSGMTREEARTALEQQVHFDEHLRIDFYASADDSGYALVTTTYDPDSEIITDIFGKPVEPGETQGLQTATDSDGNPVSVDQTEPSEPEEPEESETLQDETEPSVIPDDAPLDENGEPLPYVTTLTLLASDLDIQLDLDQVVELAYREGRGGSIFSRVKDNLHVSRYDLDITEYLSFNEEQVRETLEAMASGSALELTQSSVTKERITLEDDEGEQFEADALCITLGTMGRTLDTQALYDQIMTALSEDSYQLQYIFEEEYPEPVDLDALYAQYCTAPVNAVCDEDTYEITDGKNGFGFTMAQALASLEAAKPGETVTLPLLELEPQYTREKLESQLFTDVLGSYDSWHVWNPVRTENLNLACKAIDGTIIKPGETFSFNDIVGERTAAKGYGEAAVYVGGLTEDQLGGGVCQVASTIYYCTLEAELEVIERYEHQFAPTYVPYGMDATIYWGSLDYRFRNSTGYPIRIDASVSDGYVHVRLVGTETRDYTVKLDYKVTKTVPYEEVEVEIYPEMRNYDKYKDFKTGDTIVTAYTGYEITTYRYRIDRDGNYIYSEVVNYTHYDHRDKQIAKLRNEEPSESTGDTTEPTDPEPTETDPTEPDTGETDGE